jgi:hypothetical protein
VRCSEANNTTKRTREESQNSIEKSLKQKKESQDVVVDKQPKLKRQKNVSSVDITLNEVGSKKKGIERYYNFKKKGEIKLEM